MEQEPQIEIELEWMPVYWDRFMKATQHMDATQVGAYLLLIREQWFKKSIPNHIGKLLNIARLGKGKKAEENLRVVLEKFKPLDADRLYNETCNEIWNEQYQKYLVNKKRGENGGKKKAENRSRTLLQVEPEVKSNSTDRRSKIEEIPKGIIQQHQHTHELFSKKIFTEECDYDRVQLELGLKEKRLITDADCQQFNAHLHTEGRKHIHFSEWKSHLRNWLNTRPTERVGQNLTKQISPKNGKDLSSESTYENSKSVL